MRYVIIGSGAIGGALGARLAGAGGAHPPVLVARGDHGRALSTSGLRLRTPDEDITIPVVVAQTPQEVTLRDDDVLVLTTKTHQAEAALRDWVDRPVLAGESAADPGATVVGTAGERLPILLALNGVASERMALRYFERVFGVCVWLPAVHLEPGEVILRIAPTSGMFLIGRYAGPGVASPADRELLATVTADWTAASFVVHTMDDVMRWKYAKLLSNLGNALQALLGARSPSLSTIADRLRTEAEEVYRSAGIEWASPDEEAALRGDVFDNRPVPGTPTELGGSSWQSMARGSGTIETDYLNGEIAYLARSNGGRAPLNAMVARLAREAAVAGAGAGSMTADELERRLDEAERAAAP
ncbi:ketopantoate reductase family protein [Planctomonas psychrotolerans]|uniref:ketopantoate reductase family protein n=1 Tax=Planctomonas psychrotolerans TaxID=2528712 RepID=UPI00123C5101|nr:2-dehydropantoate 2-reductase N-terminal domain-containing protein [Planctomonas psychrotolerans]